jgi:hypothetical protein
VLVISMSMDWGNMSERSRYCCDQTLSELERANAMPRSVDQLVRKSGEVSVV